MKNDSPNKFLGGIAGSSARAARGSGSLRGIFGGISGLMGGNANLASSLAAQQAMQASQQAGAVDAAPITPTAGMSTNMENPFEGKTFQITPANMMGNAKPTFSEQTQGMAQTAFGSDLERQMSMPNSGSVTQMSAKQEKAFGPGSEVYEGGNTAIYEGLKEKE